MRLFLALLFSTSFVSIGQNSYKLQVVDSLSLDPVIAAKVVIVGTRLGGVTDVEGNVSIKDIHAGTHVLRISAVGYAEKEISRTFPFQAGVLDVAYLKPTEVLDEIIIEATRANKTVANLPTRTEVLTEEIDEAASMESGKIAHLITHSTGIQVQTTSAGSNGAVVRIQGMYGRYTQVLKDGFPLYGGFSGSLDILQIPPLDLRQVEYIKGSASTLYGGGAIAGLVNLLTKKPNKDETLLHVNLSHIGSKDFNAFAARRFGKWGFTNLGSLHLLAPYDADGDGFSDVPDVSKFNFNPKLFFYPDSKSEIYVGANIMQDNRIGGDMNIINSDNLTPLDFYYDKQKSQRYTSQLSANRKLLKNSTITLKNSISVYDRLIEIGEDIFGNFAKFGGQAVSSFSELNYNINAEKHNVTIGFNLTTDRFRETEYLTTLHRDQEYLTFGLFINHLWDINKKIALETGLRADNASAKSKISERASEFYVLPRMSALFKLHDRFAIRLGGGMGYRQPTIFTEEAEPFGYKNIAPIDFANVRTERSAGGNVDFKFNTDFGSDDLLFTFNQMFFANQIATPITLQVDSTGGLFYANQSNLSSQNSIGFESQIKFTFYWFTWFFGYTYTDAYFTDENSVETALTLTPKHSIKGDLLFVIDDKWRIGWDYDYKSFQYLSNGTKTRELFTTGVVVERTIKNFVIFLNAENFTDVRQTRYESILGGPSGTPQHTEIYAPLDGFFFNGGLKIKL